jgi:hypothetical protein
MTCQRFTPLSKKWTPGQYVGHVDSSVTGKHYQSTDPIELFDLL